MPDFQEHRNADANAIAIAIAIAIANDIANANANANGNVLRKIVAWLAWLSWRFANVSNLLAYLISAVSPWFSNSILSRLHTLL